MPKTKNSLYAKLNVKTSTQMGGRFFFSKFTYEFTKTNAVLY